MLCQSLLYSKVTQLYTYIHPSFFFNLFLAVLGLCCGAWASHCSGFSCYGAQALGAWAPVVVARRLSSCGSRALEHRLRSCGTQV